MGWAICLVATTDLAIQRAIASRKRLGFVEEGVLRQFGFWKGAFQDVRMFALLRSKWQTHALKASAKPLASQSA
jgi:RimJ/RimL family protein N-acetyltransferase